MSGSAIHFTPVEEDVLTDCEVRVRTLVNGDRHVVLLKPGRQPIVVPLTAEAARTLGNALSGSLEIAATVPPMHHPA